ncbi:hypothetical protein HPP92_029155 [Vanilla planifolia]|uniref:Uncharacterized protein n=1 Tax=Vanilla planifolia TaxID=51239 RepID=A0A835P4P6_VANPL|nr:hypothetical protein HPP92_029155 [Vanilla planifolia]KAG0445822.1 hypothetical protein HPP92_029144 [Vanilla planifolia]
MSKFRKNGATNWRNSLAKSTNEVIQNDDKRGRKRRASLSTEAGEPAGEAARIPRSPPAFSSPAPSPQRHRRRTPCSVQASDTRARRDTVVHPERNQCSAYHADLPTTSRCDTWLVRVEPSKDR